MLVPGILVVIALVALALILQPAVESIDEHLDERDEMRQVELHNRLLAGLLRGEREARAARDQARAGATESTDHDGRKAA